MPAVFFLLWTCSAVEAQSSVADPNYVEVFSGGFYYSNDVIIRVGDHTFFENVADCAATSGLYAVAIYENDVLWQCFYHTYQLSGASEGLFLDIDALPAGALVIVAAKDEPTRCFDQRGQDALVQIGANVGLLNQPFRIAYLCVGVKGMSPGEAIEMVGLADQHYTGSLAGEHLDLVFPPVPDPPVSSVPGLHEGLIVNQTEVLYYIPENFNPATAEYFVGIHGAGDWHRIGAMHRITQFRELADLENLVILSPSFDAILNWPPVWPDDFDEYGNFADPQIVKNRYIWDFVGLLSHWHQDRADKRLVEIMDFFNSKLMDRSRFYLYGHSGGGQFVSRFATLYADRLYSPVAFGSPGTYAFPRRDIDFPFGIKMDNLIGSFGPQIEADELNLTESQMNERINAYLDLETFIIVGGDETGVSNPEQSWQGASTLERAQNYYQAMMQEHQYQIQQGNRDPLDPYRFELCVQAGIGHDSDANAKAAMALMFPRSTGDMNRDGVVDLADVSIMAEYWLVMSPYLPTDVAPGPFGDGVVDVMDLEVLIGNWLISFP